MARVRQGSTVQDMSTETDQALRQQIAATYRPGRWAQLRPLLQRLGHAADAGPDTVLDWLLAASAGSRHEADKALRAMTVQLWSVAGAADGSLTLQAGGRVWRLMPQPAHRPATWRVSST